MPRRGASGSSAATRAAMRSRSARARSIDTPGTQAPHHVQEIVAPSVEQVSRRERHRQPELGAPVGEPEGRRHHADHGVGSAVEGHRRAQDRRAPTEPVAPQRVAEENDAIGAGDLFVRAKGAAQERPHAEQREHPRAGAGGR